MTTIDQPNQPNQPNQPVPLDEAHPDTVLAEDIALTEATREATRREVHAMFRRSGEDPVNLALCKAVLEYRLGKVA